jgi:O-antigen/teichoic acid export membrane protein
MAQLATRDDRAALATLYHKSCQLLSLIVIPIWIIVALFSRQLLMLYLRNAETVNHVYLLLSLLVTGTALNALMTLPFGLQLAYGYTKLSLYKNLVAVILFVPALRWMILHYGSAGAAWMWIAINGAYVVTEIPLMHRRLLPGEMRRWYLLDVGLPLLITVGVVTIARWIIRDTLPLPAATVGIALAALFAFGAAALTMHWVRRRYAPVPLGYSKP